MGSSLSSLCQKINKELKALSLFTGGRGGT